MVNKKTVEDAGSSTVATLFLMGGYDLFSKGVSLEEKGLGVVVALIGFGIYYLSKNREVK